jgi:hypothetical protein
VEVYPHIFDCFEQLKQHHHSVGASIGDPGNTSARALTTTVAPAMARAVTTAVAKPASPAASSSSIGLTATLLPAVGICEERAAAVYALVDLLTGNRSIGSGQRGRGATGNKCGGSDSVDLTEDDAGDDCAEVNKKSTGVTLEEVGGICEISDGSSSGDSGVTKEESAARSGGIESAMPVAGGAHSHSLPLYPQPSTMSGLTLRWYARESVRV